MRERFRDGASILATYSWDINHWREEPDERRRAITRTAPTSGTDYVRQQGAPTPVTFKFSGTIMKQSQFDAMSDYFEACEIRTVFYRDVYSTEHEVVITAFSTRKEAVARNFRDPNLMHVWRYDLEMEVIA